MSQSSRRKSKVPLLRIFECKQRSEHGGYNYKSISKSISDGDRGDCRIVHGNPVESNDVSDGA